MLARRGSYRLLAAIASAWLMSVVVLAPTASGQGIGEELAAKLSPDQQRSYVLYLRARAAFELDVLSYWASVDGKRDERKRKRATGQPFARSDYILEHPPKYAGPSLAPEIAKIVASIKKPEPEAAPKAGVADFLAAAKKEFGFVPTPTTDKAFKIRYAEEAIAHGLTKDHVVRIYALETGGRGTFDMQAGIDPDSKKGQPISSALGYAQLLGANSTSELVKHGEMFSNRLSALAATSPGPRASSLKSKVTVIRRMIAAAKSIPNEWSAHVKFAGTPKGLGIHALNLDADVGPMLQAIKLKGLKDEAERAGRGSLSGAEIELMNLAGPRTGLEMMEPVAKAVPTSNFFSHAAYARNSVVRDKTAAELLVALNDRMELALKKAGSIEFAAAFDEVSGKADRLCANAGAVADIEEPRKKLGANTLPPLSCYRHRCG